MRTHAVVRRRYDVGNGPFEQSPSAIIMRSRLTLLALAATSLAATSLAVAAPAHAQPRWKPIGKTNVGNPVEIDTRLKHDKDIVKTMIRTRFVPPKKTQKGNITTARTELWIDCTKRMVAMPVNTYYIDEAKNVVYQTSRVGIPGYAPAMGGSGSELAVGYVCKGVK